MREWISVDERLPEAEETEYDEENDCFWIKPCWYEVNVVDDNPNWELTCCIVTHWMPLPEPPKENTQ